MPGCANPEPYYPRHEDGTCHYWKRVDARGIEHPEPICTYWNNEAWRANCEHMGIEEQRQRREHERRRALTEAERAEEDGRLF